MHDTDEAHDHFDLAALGPDVRIEDVEGLEMFRLTSVGIDIGSATSHLVFSRLTLRRQGAALSGRFTVTNRDILYRSQIMLTPYLSETLIDIAQVQQFRLYRSWCGGMIPICGDGSQCAVLLGLHDRT